MAEGNSELSSPQKSSRREFLKTVGIVGGGLLAKKVIDPVQLPAEQLIDGVINTPKVIEKLPEIETANNEGPEFYVVMPGFGGSGKDLTYIRGLMDKKYGPDNNYIPSSISEKDAYTRKDLQGGYYKKLAQEIAKKAGNKKITIVGHSLGGLEMLSLSKELLKTDWRGLDLKLNFYVTPGLGATGILSLVDMGMRIVDMSDRFGELDQHILYPLPEMYYEKKDKPVIPDDFTSLEDSPKARKDRRAYFVSLAAKHPEVFTNGEASDVLTQIDTKGQEITEASSVQEIQLLLRNRGDLLRPVLDALAAGETINPVIHDDMLAQYKETDQFLLSGSPISVLSAQANLIGAIGEIVKNQAQGVDGTIAEIVTLAERRGVTAGINLVLAENDLALTAQDVEVFQGRLGQRQMGDYLKTILYLQNEGHTTFGYTPVVTEKILPNT